MYSNTRRSVLTPKGEYFRFTRGSAWGTAPTWYTEGLQKAGLLLSWKLENCFERWVKQDLNKKVDSEIQAQIEERLKRNP